MSNYKKGIDVSEHNGVIDWEKVKASGVEFAMIRAGYGKTVDKQFHRNAGECNRVGLPCGIYWFSYALNAVGAAQEAAVCLETIKPYQIDYPVAFDLEYDSVNYAQKLGVYIGTGLASDNARAFCRAVRNAGYHVVNYANPDYLNRYFDDAVKTEFPIWLAQWPYGTPDLTAPPKTCDIWQYSQKGSVPGISGPVDLDVCYAEYEKENREEAEQMPVYKKLEDVPEWYRDSVRKVIDNGALKGVGNGDINVSEDMCRILTVLDRLGKLD